MWAIKISEQRTSRVVPFFASSLERFAAIWDRGWNSGWVTVEKAERVVYQMNACTSERMIKSSTNLMGCCMNK